MAMDQYLQEASLQSGFDEGKVSFKKWSSDSKLDDEPETNSSGGFECNICLDLVQDPVVTFCGHLYCWPCIYRWISFPLEDSDQQKPRKPQCPVCKAEVSQKTLIPLYGRGQSTDSSPKDELSQLGVLIPQRPPSPRCGSNMLSTPNTTTNDPSPYQRGYAQPPPPYHNHLGGSTTRLMDPMIGMFGEMVYSRIFGNSETTMYTYPNSNSYPNSYRLAGSTSPRLRRHMMQTDKSLSRVCFFLCCCVLLCLLLF